LVVGALSAVLAGCGSEPPAPAPAPTATTAAVDAAYVEALAAIDRELVDNEKAAVNNGHNICLDIKQGKTLAELQKNTAARFEVGTAEAKKIVAVTRSTLCSAG
jgi:hypothetical protein